MTARAATLPFPFSFLFFDKIVISTETFKINEEENKNTKASKLDSMNESNIFSVFLSYCQTKPLKIWQLTSTAKLV